MRIFLYCLSVFSFVPVLSCQKAPSRAAPDPAVAVSPSQANSPSVPVDAEAQSQENSSGTVTSLRSQAPADTAFRQLSETKWLIKGRELAFSSISKHENGMLERGWAESDFSFPLRGKEYRFRGGFPANFHPCGQLKRAFLVEAQSFFIAGGDSKFEFTISFHKNGRVSLGYLSQDQTFHVGGREYLFKAGLYTGFFESGKVRRGFLKGDHTVPIGGKNYTFREASIFFYESGAVHEGFLLNGGTYRGKDYLAGKLGP